MFRRRRSSSIALWLFALQVLALQAPALANGVPPPPPERPPGRSIELTCPSLEVPPAGFADVAADNVHGRAIDCMRHRGLIEGVGDNNYQPAGLVTRAQMATVVARLIEVSGGDLPDDSNDSFTDDEGSVHEASINQLAALGVVSGKSASTFDPGGHVSRGQMASLMIRAVEHRLDLELTVRGEPFADDDDDVHETSINKAASAGVVAGLGDGRYDPNGVVVRDQMASFVIRALDLVVSRPSWERAVALIETCQVDGIFQAHDLRASLDLKNGTVHHTTQPYLDAVFDVVAASNCPEPVDLVTE
jgi:hypothetical protein